MIGITLKGTRVYEEAREEEATNIILRLLKKRLGQELSHIGARASREFTLTNSRKSM